MEFNTFRGLSVMFAGLVPFNQINYKLNLHVNQCAPMWFFCNDHQSLPAVPSKFHLSAWSQLHSSATPAHTPLISHSCTHSPQPHLDTLPSSATVSKPQPVLSVTPHERGPGSLLPGKLTSLAPSTSHSRPAPLRSKSPSLALPCPASSHCHCRSPIFC